MLCGTRCEANTLIVTYQTGIKGERLDRVRFLLIDSKKQQKMYPQGDVFVEDPSNLLRMVIVREIPPGQYTIEFLVPNCDGIFEEVTPRQFTINADGVIKIDQVIKVRYASLDVRARPGSEKHPFASPPKILLHDENQKICAQAEAESLNATHLLPGKYTITFAPMVGYRTPAPIEISLSPYENAGPFVGVYEKEGRDKR